MTGNEYSKVLKDGWIRIRGGSDEILNKMKVMSVSEVGKRKIEPETSIICDHP